MDRVRRLELLTGDAGFELTGPPSAGRASGCIYHATQRGGRRVPLLKTLLENRCVLGCGYCAQSRHCDARSAALEPAELAALFDELQRGRLVQGLFLSSAIRGHPDRNQERMVAAVELLRTRYRFGGYVHLKILPGSSPELALRAARVADRLSINIEAPTADRLAAIAPEKARLGRAGHTIALLSQLVARPDLRVRGQSTQIVVGAGEESDEELLRTASVAYGRFALERVYYSGFHPIPGTPLAHRAAVASGRLRRLYQADVLVRDYGFAVDDLVFAGGALDEARDPKEAWARAHPERFPVEVNRAAREDLLRVPGLGPVTVQRVLAQRRGGLLQRPEDAAVPARAVPYLLFAGRTRAPAGPRQLSLAGAR